MNVRAGVLAGLVVANGLSAAGGEPAWQTWRMQRNFPWNLVTSIVPDGNRVWFGGRKLMPGEQDGLAVHDKTTGAWRLLLDTEGILAEDINRLAMHNGELWIGSDGWRPFNQGLAVFDPRTGGYRRYTPEDGLPHWRVRDMTFAGTAVWIATHQGAARYDPEADTWTQYGEPDGLGSRFLICAASDRDFVWFGSFEGLEQYDRHAGTWRSWRRGDGILPAHVQALLADEDRVWISSPPHIVIYDRKTRSFRRFAEGDAAAAAEVTHIRRDGQEIFFGTTTGGLHVWHTLQRSWRVYTTDGGLADNHVYALGVDADHVWCAGSRGRPLSRLDRRTGRWRQFRFRDGVPANFLYSVARAGDWLFAGTMGNGFWKYHLPSGDHWQNLNLVLLVDGRDFLYQADQTPIQIADIYAQLVVDQHVWMGTNHGICRYGIDWERPGFELIPGLADACIALAAWHGLIVVGTRGQGLHAFDPATGVWQDLDPEARLERRTIHALQADAGTLWLGTGDGLWRLDGPGASPQPVEIGPGRAVTALLRQDDTLWIGARDGLFRYEPETARMIRDERPRGSVTSLAWADDALWIGTRTGLLRFDPATGRVQEHTVDATGLGWNHVGGLAADADRIWVGTLGGGLSFGNLKRLAPTGDD